MKVLKRAFSSLFRIHYAEDGVSTWKRLYHLRVYRILFDRPLILADLSNQSNQPPSSLMERQMPLLHAYNINRYDGV